jgi:hypothetical protein
MLTETGPISLLRYHSVGVQTFLSEPSSHMQMNLMFSGRGIIILAAFSGPSQPIIAVVRKQVGL